MKYLLSVILTFCCLLTASCSVFPEMAPKYDPTVDYEIDDIKKDFPSLSNVPVLYIDIDKEVWLITKEEYISAVVTAPDSGLVEVDASLKGRGNASWGLPQKPFNLKFPTETNLFGMGSAKSWVLITLFYDKTLLRNYLTLNLAETVSSGAEMDCMFVEVVLNGEYNGLYLLTEKVEDEKTRVDLSKKTGDALFEIEQAYRHNDICDNCIHLKSNTHITFKDPEPEDLTDVEFENLHEQMSGLLTDADNAIRSRDFQQISKFIDVDSFIDWYIVNEFVKNYDSQFVTSCYCYIKNGILYMGPCWDYDTCMGNQDVASCLSPNGLHVRQAPWFNHLMRTGEFFDLVCERWNELVADGVFDGMLKSIDEQTEYLSEASVSHFERWPDSLRSSDLRGRHALFTYEEEISYLKDWIEKRVEYLNQKWTVD